MASEVSISERDIKSPDKQPSKDISTTDELIDRKLLTVIAKAEFGLDTPEQIAEDLRSAKEAETLGFLSALNRLQSLRQINAYERKDSIIDETIVVLAQQGQMDLAAALLTPSPKEKDVMQSIIRENIPDVNEQDAMNQRIGEAFVAKQRHFSNTLSAKGVSIQDQRAMLNNATNPEDALDIPDDFWEIYNSFPIQAKSIVTDWNEVKENAAILQTIYYHGLIDYPYDIFEKLRTIADPEEKKAFLNSLENANKLIPQDQKRRDSITRGYLMRSFIKAGVVTQDVAQALVTLQVYINKNKKLATAPGFDAAAVNIAKKADPRAAADDLIQAYELAKSYIAQDKTHPYTIDTQEDPLAYVEVLQAVDELAQREKRRREKPRNGIKSLFARRTPDYTRYHEKITIAETELRKQGLSLFTMNEGEAQELLDTIYETPQHKDIAVKCKTWEAKKQYRQLIKDKIDIAIQTGDPKDIKSDVITLDRMPALQQRFDELAISPELADDMYASWHTYNAYDSAMYELHLKPNETPTKEQMIKVLEETNRKFPAFIGGQIEALTSYAEHYGKEELHEIINTFGVYNFLRAEKWQLHSQLQRWKAGKDLPKNILVKARTDWNAALISNKQQHDLFGEEGFYYFEANDAKQIAAIAVAIGNRERENLRDPLQTNSVENFVINAHADPYGLLLGVYGDRLNAADYANAEQERTETALKLKTISPRVRDFRRHLGNKFRLILQGCNTAGEAMNGKNIKTAIGEGHNVRTEGSTDLVKSFTVNADNTVTFINMDKEKTESSPYIPPEQIAA